MLNGAARGLISYAIRRCDRRECLSLAFPQGKPSWASLVLTPRSMSRYSIGVELRSLPCLACDRRECASLGFPAGKGKLSLLTPLAVLSKLGLNPLAVLCKLGAKPAPVFFARPARPFYLGLRPSTRLRMKTDLPGFCSAKPQVCTYLSLVIGDHGLRSDAGPNRARSRVCAERKLPRSRTYLFGAVAAASTSLSVLSEPEVAASVATAIAGPGQCALVVLMGGMGSRGARGKNRNFPLFPWPPEAYQGKYQQLEWVSDGSR
jgi:hypothetical protein